MLSSLPGTAISQIKIDGVQHEFSCIPGVKEDVTEIVLNIKDLAIRNNSTDDEPKKAYIDFSGEGTVTGADIEVDQDIEIVNPDQVIATLSGGADCRDDHHEWPGLCERRKGKTGRHADRHDRCGCDLYAGGAR